MEIKIDKYVEERGGFEESVGVTISIAGRMDKYIRIGDDIFKLNEIKRVIDMFYDPQYRKIL